MVNVLGCDSGIVVTQEQVLLWDNVTAVFRSKSKECVRQVKRIDRIKKRY